MELTEMAGNIEHHWQIRVILSVDRRTINHFFQFHTLSHFFCLLGSTVTCRLPGREEGSVLRCIPKILYAESFDTQS